VITNKMIIFTRCVPDFTTKERNAVMTRDEIASKVKDIICEQLNRKRDEIKDETNFINDLSADSLDIAEITMEFEDEFDVQIPEDAKIENVGQAIDYIEKHQTGK